MNRDSKRPVTLEDLLQLKRAERPPAEFWTRFERDLRAKQLAALVEKRPWWRSMPKVFAGFSRYHLPIGATAVLAFSFVAIRGYQTTSVGPVDSSRVAPAVVASAAAPSARTVSTETATVPSAAPAALHQNLAVTAINEAPASLSVDPVVPVVAMLDNRATDLDTPSARTIASNRAAAQVLDPELSNRFLASAHGFETRALPVRQAAVEPLTQVSVSEARRSRLIATAVPAAYNASSPESSEKIARRISDERLYDTVTRFGARGDRLNVKF